jgi:SecD/SecF fusion protein
MQLKGLVRFFTIFLILFSIYQLSFTWFVNKHEKKMETRAMNYIKRAYPSAQEKYASSTELRALYQDTLDRLYKSRLKELLDSTKEDKVTWWGTSYNKARQSELNLGLDLQGGMNVTLEVELSSLLRSMSNNSRDPVFLKALELANQRKANSDADFISLFVEEYKKLAGTGKMSGLFAAANPDLIKIGDSDAKVESVIRKEAGEAINRTYSVLGSRIDQFGVAQPNLNLQVDKGIITVELPGIDDEERVRKYLQASANLEFWEVYNFVEIMSAFGKAELAFNTIMSGTSAKSDTATKSDTTASKSDTSDILSEQLGQTTQSTDTTTAATKHSLGEIIGFVQGQKNAKGEDVYPAWVGFVKIKDTARARRYLSMDGVINSFPADARFHFGIPPRDKNNKASDYVPLYVIRTYGSEKSPIEGDAITNARLEFDPTSGVPTVSMSMNTSGRNKWATLTKKSFERKIPIAIVLDNVVYSAPVANQMIEGGNSQITGDFTVEEATDLSNILKVGKLPAPAKIVQEQVVGPTLGADAIHGGGLAFTISFVVIFLLMLIYYNTSGWVANIALILNLLFTVSILAAFGATLTAPGIAGLVLTIGMAVDTNVVIYERIKEELTRGKSYQQAINDGYRRSLPPVLDGHITTLLTAIILFYFGLGPVKGFATTQIIGILLSLFCGILVSRWVTEWFTNKKKHLVYFTTISRKVFQHANFKFIEKRKIAYAISVVILGLGIASFFNGFDQGVEFKGGRSYIVDFHKPADVEAVRKDLSVAFEESPVIKTIGTNSQLDITTSYQIDDTRPQADSMVQAKLYSGLKNHLPPDVTAAKFANEYRIGSKKVLPTISDDLKKGARTATIFAMIAIALYIFMRFRDWRYSLGTIASLLHDVFVMIIVFSFLRKVVGFPLEIDQHFIAAVLTVIGFSMNDTVIIFDRIREYSRLMKGATKETIINRAINDTMSRTIMTSLTVFLTLLILFLVGGEVTRGFAFAMLIGVVTGIYSSVFVAAPVLVDLARKKSLGEANLAEKEKLRKPVAKPVVAK